MFVLGQMVLQTVEEVTIVDSVIVFVVGLLIGALGIYAGARVVTDAADYGHAIVTALIGAIVWVIVAFFLGWIPLLGPLLALVAYVAVINYRYPGGWGNAIAIAFIAWIAALVVLYLLALFNLASFDAIGVPGV